MGKIEDMRRLREQQFADAAQREAKTAKVAPAPARAAPTRAAPTEPVAPPPRATRAEPTTTARTSSRSNAKGSPSDEQGKCPDCGKMKPLSNGVMASHQKGFGKACSGSRKKPS